MIGSKLKGLAITAGLSLILALIALPFIAPYVSGRAFLADASVVAITSVQTWVEAFCEVIDAGEGPRSLLLSWALLTVLAVWAETTWFGTPKGQEVEDGSFDLVKPYRGKQVLKHMVPWDGRSAAPDGIVVGYDPKTECYLTLPAVHSVTVAPSGSGKSRRQTLENLDLKSAAGVGLIVTDPSLELVSLSRQGLIARGYDVFILDVDNGYGDRWNPLSEVTRLCFKEGDAEAAGNLCVDIAAVLCPSPAEAGPNAWCYREAASVLAAYMYEVATSREVPDSQRHLYSVAKGIIELTSASGAEGLKRHFRNSKDDTELVLASSFLAAEDRQIGSILSTLLDSVTPFASASMRYVTSASDIDINAMCDPASKTAVFVKALGRDNPRSRVASAFIEVQMRAQFRAGERRGNTKETWLIADEAASLCCDLVLGLQQGRKMGWHALAYYQDTTEASMGPKRDAILSNCDVKCLYKAGQTGDARLFSELSGSKTLAVRSSSETSGGSVRTTSESWGEQRTPAWDPAQLIHNNPARDGIFVVSSISNHPELSGLFEGVPVCDVTETPMASSFPGIGSREHEARWITMFLDELKRSALMRDRTVTAWVPSDARPSSVGGGENDGDYADLFME